MSAPLVAARIESWFSRVARDLPWREASGARRDPYRVLVSELMLQQTQVSRVLERFNSFLLRFPTLALLAQADESEVLAEWSGLGYYRRARHLHAAAKRVMESHGGELPRDAASLRNLPGVGRYTAGAIASIAFSKREPLVDGNVARVLMRVHGRAGAVGERRSVDWAWSRAAELVETSVEPGVLNEGLMELGATLCLPAPAAPRCGECPLSDVCRARRDGTQRRIPHPKVAAEKRDLFCASVVVRDSRGLMLVERRGDSGMWAGLWQVPTIEREDREPTPGEIGRLFAPGNCAAIVPVNSFQHQTTHRRVVFKVYSAQVRRRSGVRRDGDCRWLSAADAGALGLSTPQRRVLEACSN